MGLFPVYKKCQTLKGKSVPCYGGRRRRRHDCDSESDGPKRPAHCGSTPTPVRPLRVSALNGPAALAPPLIRRDSRRVADPAGHVSSSRHARDGSDRGKASYTSTPPAPSRINKDESNRRRGRGGRRREKSRRRRRRRRRRGHSRRPPLPIEGLLRSYRRGTPSVSRHLVVSLGARFGAVVR